VGNGGGIYNNGTATLKNSTVNNNQAVTNGGGIYNYNTGQTFIYGSAISGNSASGDGGGIYNITGTAHQENDTLTGNLSANDGGIYNLGTTDLYNVTLSNNTASTSDGGGIINQNFVYMVGSNLTGSSAKLDGGGIANFATANLYYSTFTGNKASGSGGGILNQNFATLDHSTLSGNSAYGGGGIANLNTATMQVTNATLNANSANNSSGGISNLGGTTSLRNSTLSGNSAQNVGGGLYTFGNVTFYNATLANNRATSGGALYLMSGHTTILTNTILAYSLSGGNCDGTITASKFTFSRDNTCALPITDTIHGLNPNGLDLLLTALGTYGGPTQVHMLKLGSPAIDGIVGNDAPSTDQRDFVRPRGNGYDIGAVERQPTDSDLLPRVYLSLILR
jgi:hypothetical protein